MADHYVATGNIAADHAWHLGLEGPWNEGPVSLLAEYKRAWLDRFGTTGVTDGVLTRLQWIS